VIVLICGRITILYPILITPSLQIDYDYLLTGKKRESTYSGIKIDYCVMKFAHSYQRSITFLPEPDYRSITTIC
jgi:hypothetical protein